MKKRSGSEPDIIGKVLSFKGILTTFLLLFFCFYVIYRGTMTLGEVLEKSALATGAILLVSVLAGLVDKALKSRRGPAPQVDTDTLDDLSDEEYEALRRSILTRRNALRAAVYFYGLSLTVSIIGLYDAGVWKILAASALCFATIALMFFSRLLYVRIRYGTWTAPRRN